MRPNRLPLVVAALCVVIGLALPAAASAANSYFKNSAIASEAERLEKTRRNKVGGWCYRFVADALAGATNGRISPRAGEAGYQGTFRAKGGTRITDPNAAVRGDIIQVTPAGTSDSWFGERRPLHTTIVLRRLGGWNFEVIDSNWDNLGPGGHISRHRFNPFTFDPRMGGRIAKIWRLGKVSSPAKPKPKDTDKDGVPDSQDRCPRKKGPKSNKGCPSRPSSDGITVKGFYTPISGDFNGDRRSDVLWYGPADDHDALWYGSESPGVFSDAPVTVKGTYTPISGDFNGDGRTDILWYGPGDAFDSMWYGGPGLGEFTTSVDVTVKGTYNPISGDFNGDGRSDILWYGPGDAPDSIWYGGTTQGQFTTGVDATVKGTYTPISGDFNGDRRSDVLWYGPADGHDALWYGSESLGVFSDAPVTVVGTYNPISGDFNGDGRTDILWYGPGDAYDSLWVGLAAAGSFAHP